MALDFSEDESVAPQVGLEPTTYGLTVRRSNRLSYWGTKGCADGVFYNQISVLAPQVGLEPTTYGLTVRRSNRLSY